MNVPKTLHSTLCTFDILVGFLLTQWLSNIKWLHIFKRYILACYRNKYICLKKQIGHKYQNRTVYF